MSGGVDSSAAAALMLEKGFHCFGITLKLYRGEGVCCSLADIDDARNVSLNLGMEHHVLDFTEEFEEQVVRHFIETYEQGLTPNPCIECNRRIKFNLPLLMQGLMQASKTFASKMFTSRMFTSKMFTSTIPLPFVFDFFVTGHYARVTQDALSGRFLLQKALDDKKDQSYVLYSLTQQQLGKACFPLGALAKNEVRKIAKDRKLVNAAKKESQDICFVPDGDYGNFIEKYTGKAYPHGDIVDLEGKIIGRHKGLIRYTIGQRRGLGVAANAPVYVTAKSTAANTVTLGPDSALYSKSLTAGNINLIACPDLKKPMRVMVKTRYLQAAQLAVAEQTGTDCLHIEFDSLQRAITPGQAAVMYDGDVVVGGGTIM